MLVEESEQVGVSRVQRLRLWGYASRVGKGREI